MTGSYPYLQETERTLTQLSRKFQPAGSSSVSSKPGAVATGYAHESLREARIHRLEACPEIAGLTHQTRARWRAGQP